MGVSSSKVIIISPCGCCENLPTSRGGGRWQQQHERSYAPAMGWSCCTYLNIYPLDSKMIISIKMIYDGTFPNTYTQNGLRHIRAYMCISIYIYVCVCTYHVHITYLFIYLSIHPSIHPSSIYPCVFFSSKSLSQHMAKALQESMTMSCSQNVGSCHLYSPTGFNPKVPPPP